MFNKWHVAPNVDTCVECVFLVFYTEFTKTVDEITRGIRVTKHYEMMTSHCDLFFRAIRVSILITKLLSLLIFVYAHLFHLAG